MNNSIAATGWKQTITYGTKNDTFFANDFVDQNTTFFFSSSLVMAINLVMAYNITTSPLAVWTLLQCLILIGGQKNNAIFVIHPFYSKRLNRFVPSLWLVNDLIQPSQADPWLVSNFIILVNCHRTNLKPLQGHSKHSEHSKHSLWKW